MSAAGAIARQILREAAGIEVVSWVRRVQDIDSKVDALTVTPEQVDANDVRCPDPEAAEKMIDRIAAEDGMLIEYQLLADPDNAVIDRYGVFNDESQRPVPHPTVFVIDKQGVVHWKFIEIDYRIRPTNDDILAAVAELE